MDNWIIKEDGFSRDNIELNGSRFTIGNGYYGYRGTLDEFRAEDLCALTLSGIYDDANGWREIVNGPNPLYTCVYYHGQQLNVKKSSVISHVQKLDMRSGLLERKTVYGTEDGNRLTFSSARISGCSRSDLLMAEYRVSLEKGGTVELTVGFDRKIWECSGPHFRTLRFSEQQGVLLAQGITGELGKEIVTGALTCCENKDSCCGKFTEDTEDMLAERLIFTLQPKEEVRIIRYISIRKDNDSEKCIRTVRRYAETGYDAILSEICSEKQKQWDKLDIVIRGDDTAQLALRHNMYLLLIAASFDDAAIAIPARGLSGQVYKGAMFWDTEMYMLPMFLYEFPEAAVNLVKYRIVNLDKALKKAEEYGYYGAFYPWESQESGDEGCTHYNLTDIFTGRKVRTYFRDKQIHISADVAYGIWKYYEVTEDISVLTEGGARTLFECARFFCSYALFKMDKNRYEFTDVTGADEYHERVNNNAYTNGMIRYCTEKALEALETVKREAPEEFKSISGLPYYESSVEQIRHLHDHIYVPAPGDKGIIEQFDGFFRLEDCSLEDIRRRIINPKEYLGSPTGLCVETQISKQADVALLLSTLSDRYSREVKKANFDYYEPRTEHGSSLSACIYALLAAQTGETEWAYRYFMKTALLDLTGDYKLYLGPLYIGGTHPAANGGTWRVMIEGFAGMKSSGSSIRLEPKLPKQWEEVSFHIQIRKNHFYITVTQGYIEVRAADDNNEEFRLETGSSICTLKKGETQRMTYKK